MNLLHLKFPNKPITVSHDKLLLLLLQLFCQKDSFYL